MNKQAFSIIEILVVIAIFSLLSVVITQTAAITIISSRKADSTVTVRENLEYATTILERRIRGAKELTATASCFNTDLDGNLIGGTIMEYLDFEDLPHSLECIPHPTDGLLQTDTDVLTSDEISITECLFTCYAPTATVPGRVTISLTAVPKDATTAQSYPVSISTTVSLRVY